MSIESTQAELKLSEKESSEEQPSKSTQPIKIIRHNGIEVYHIDSSIMGCHAVHWDALTHDAENAVVNWLGAMIEHATIPLGLNTEGDSSSNNSSLLIVNDADIHISQMFALDENQTPCELITAFPSVNSPYTYSAKIERIIENIETSEAVLRLATSDGSVIYAFDALYAINKENYKNNTEYQVMLSGICHFVELFTEEEVLTITDADAIKHHRALNSVLEKNDGEIPDNLQAQIDDWKPENDEDTLPVQINLGQMCAYLYGENLGQEDEAWCQGEVIGLQKGKLLDTEVYLLDLVILREQNVDPIVVRTACAIENLPKEVKVGDYIRTNLWLQAKICSKT